MLVAPSEPSSLRALGTFSPLCEQMGVDFLFITERGLVGVQRKETSDLVASVRGDRFSKELSQIAESDLVTAILLIEGSWPWQDAFGRDSGYTRAEYQGLVLSVQSRGIMVCTTDDLTNTADWLTRLPVWLGREEHGSLLRVPKQRSVSVGQRLLMALDGVSLTRARAIEEHFGRVPLGWLCSAEELQAVAGIGKITAQRLIGALQGVDRVNGRG